MGASTLAQFIDLTTKICNTPNLPLDKMDTLVLGRLVDRVLTPERVTPILKQWLSHLGKTHTASEQKLKSLGKVLKTAEDGLNNLYSAIEKGVIALDATLQIRINRLKDERERVLAEMALLQREKPSARNLSTKQVAYACQRMREMLLDSNSGYGKQLLRLLVSEIRVSPEKATPIGGTTALNEVVQGMKPGTSTEVPRFITNWCGWRGSNPRPLASEANTLSTELQPQQRPALYAA